ncbi:SMI1/KNR4 family protein [Photorhabdus heterorhabditis]|uniref:SMI1/KNR4 family protein n=1 Tax=Photorhabdus heterorhabditis TaxID=880156 RepID=UPI001C256CDD|nr:SMI1/KNR4 family protein [Photorhabdus heterorhabditis]
MFAKRSCGCPVYGDGLSNKEIAEIENKYSISFPKGYVDFINKYNGLVVREPDACDIPYDNIDNGFISFDALFAVRFINDNFYILVNDQDNIGVYYWDRTHLHADDDLQKYHFKEINECRNLYKVSNSFDDFLKSILEFTKGG